uniref:Secreted protein n=1 Tax=Fagus sylvatica TaxID=28930 RepID=A0A2N9EQ92_FAGSY
MLCSALLSFLFLCLCSPSLPLLSAFALCPTLPSHPKPAFPRTTPPPPRAGPDALCLCSFSAPSLCRPRFGPDEVVGELVVEGGAVGLELGSELVVEGAHGGTRARIRALG